MANNTTCLLCRNFLNGPMRGRKRCDLKEEVDKSDENFNSYIGSLTAYEKKLNVASGPMKDHDSAVIPSFLDAIDERVAIGTKVLENWWPASALEREGVTFNKGDLKPYPGEAELGLWRD